MARHALAPLPLADVTLDSGFWGERIRLNREHTIPMAYAKCKETGRIDAFKLDWKPGNPNPPHIFWDSDVAKWVEAAAYSLATHPDPDLEALLDAVIALIASAQQPDGYLNTHFTTVEPEKRWTNLRDWHELYGAGHMIEAGVAHFQATGKRTLLDVVCRYADYIGTVFGRGPGQKRGYCGHEEIELALVKLHRATGKAAYLDLAAYFVNERGQPDPHYWDAEAAARGEKPPFHHRTSPGWLTDYWQAEAPVREQKAIDGHAVRALYLCAGMADVAAATGDASLLTACRRLWNNCTRRRMYVTGGVGTLPHGERFSANYDLSNDTAYAETCAAIALVFFAQRMLNAEADRDYADVMERALYNGVVSGVSRDGRRFFYGNMLEVNPEQFGPKYGKFRGNQDLQRQEWFGCSCCPPNLGRLLASLGQYLYSTAARALYVHLYAESRARVAFGGTPITLTQATDYPWDGRVRLSIATVAPAAFDLMLRIPGWCRRWTLSVNGKRMTKVRLAKGYALLARTWQDGDIVELELAMPVERLAAHPLVAADAGRVALCRGPIIYCLEQPDHTVDIRSLRLPPTARLTARYEPRLLGGCTVIEGPARAALLKAWANTLYQPAEQSRSQAARIKAIPYHLWANRRPGPMLVWIPQHTA